MASQILPFAGECSNSSLPLRQAAMNKMCTQCLSGIDPNVLGLWAKVESMVYANLEDGEGEDDLGFKSLDIGKKETL